MTVTSRDLSNITLKNWSFAHACHSGPMQYVCYVDVKRNPFFLPRAREKRRDRRVDETRKPARIRIQRKIARSRTCHMAEAICHRNCIKRWKNTEMWVLWTNSEIKTHFNLLTNDKKTFKDNYWDKGKERVLYILRVASWRRGPVA